MTETVKTLQRALEKLLNGRAWLLKHEPVDNPSSLIQFTDGYYAGTPSAARNYQALNKTAKVCKTCLVGPMYLTRKGKVSSVKDQLSNACEVAYQALDNSLNHNYPDDSVMTIASAGKEVLIDIYDDAISAVKRKLTQRSKVND